MDADEDAQLLLAFGQGDARAFERLYERHEGALYRFVRRLLGARATAQADEVFQDTWLRVVHHHGTFSPQGATFRTWLFTLAHHRCVDVLRKSGREVALPEEDDGTPGEPAAAEAPWLPWPAVSQVSADDALFWRRAGGRLLQCMEGLPLGQKAVFLLHHDDEMSVDDIARALGLNFETAKSRLRYAMSKLRQCMGPYLGAAAP